MMQRRGEVSGELWDTQEMVSVCDGQVHVYTCTCMTELQAYNTLRVSRVLVSVWVKILVWDRENSH